MSEALKPEQYIKPVIFVVEKLSGDGRWYEDSQYTIRAAAQSRANDWNRVKAGIARVAEYIRVGESA